MHLVDNVDLVPSLCRAVRHLLTDFSDIIDTVVGRCVDLDHIHGSTCCNRSARLTFPAGTSVHRMFAVHGFRKYLRHRCFPGSSGSAEKIRMSDTVCLDLVLQCCNDMVLPFHIRKLGRAELSVKCRIRHESHLF